ncbi:MAG: ribosomal-processing cysteine protease Prp, partial [Lachnospiraceae bacterium]|nr:ribosomal-processing cysteine protease Prp [Lachnospiraceae bacterium]
LVTNTVNSIEVLAGDEIGDEEMGDGYLSCSFPSGLSEGGNLLMEAMLLGLRQIAETTDAESGEPYVRVIYLED